MTREREARLMSEFEGMKVLRSPYCLFDFRCADLSVRDIRPFQLYSVPLEVAKNNMPGYLSSEDFERRYPGVAPEKYLIFYSCVGLRLDENEKKILKTDKHVMEIVFGSDYPKGRPIFTWLTPIFHPNFRFPYICTEGRPFAVGLSLSRIVPEIGRMVQYQNYNLVDFFDVDATEWASQNENLFPIDPRNILDSRELANRYEEPLIQIVPPEGRSTGELIELMEVDSTE